MDLAGDVRTASHFNGLLPGIFCHAINVRARLAGLVPKGPGVATINRWVARAFGENLKTFAPVRLRVRVRATHTRTRTHTAGQHRQSETEIASIILRSDLFPVVRFD